MNPFHICTAPNFTYRLYRYCRWCDNRKRHVLIDHVWWGAELVCCGCGVITDTEQGERSRPKVGANRRPLIQLWHDALPKSEYWKALHRYMGTADSTPHPTP
jgi:hypothetical protein